MPNEKGRIILDWTLDSIRLRLQEKRISKIERQIETEGDMERPTSYEISYGWSETEEKRTEDGQRERERNWK